MKINVRIKKTKPNATFKTNLFLSWFNFIFKSSALEFTRLLSRTDNFLFEEAKISFCLFNSPSTRRLLSSQSLNIVHWFSKISFLVKTFWGFSSFKIFNWLLISLSCFIFYLSSARSNNKKSISSFNCWYCSGEPCFYISSNFF